MFRARAPPPLAAATNDQEEPTNVEATGVSKPTTDCRTSEAILPLKIRTWQTYSQLPAPTELHRADPPQLLPRRCRSTAGSLRPRPSPRPPPPRRPGVGREWPVPRTGRWGSDQFLELQYRQLLKGQTSLANATLISTPTNKPFSNSSNPPFFSQKVGRKSKIHHGLNYSVKPRRHDRHAVQELLEALPARSPPRRPGTV